MAQILLFWFSFFYVLDDGVVHACMHDEWIHLFCDGLFLGSANFWAPCLGLWSIIIILFSCNEWNDLVFSESLFARINMKRGGILHGFNISGLRIARTFLKFILVNVRVELNGIIDCVTCTRTWSVYIRRVSLRVLKRRRSPNFSLDVYRNPFFPYFLDTESRLFFRDFWFNPEWMKDCLSRRRWGNRE